MQPRDSYLFLLQLAGCKHWRVYPTPLPLPYSHEQLGKDQASPLTHLALQKTELRLRRKLSPPGDDASSPWAWRAIGTESPLIGDASTAKSSDAWMTRTSAGLRSFIRSEMTSPRTSEFASTRTHRPCVGANA